MGGLVTRHHDAISPGSKVADKSRESELCALSAACYCRQRMAHPRERVPRASIIEAEDETDSPDGKDVDDIGQDDEDEASAASDADWLNDCETDLGFWFEDDGDG